MAGVRSLWRVTFKPDWAPRQWHTFNKESNLLRASGSRLPVSPFYWWNFDKFSLCCLICVCVCCFFCFVLWLVLVWVISIAGNVYIYMQISSPQLWEQMSSTTKLNKQAWNQILELNKRKQVLGWPFFVGLLDFFGSEHKGFVMAVREITIPHLSCLLRLRKRTISHLSYLLRFTPVLLTETPSKTLQKQNEWRVMARKPKKKKGASSPLSSVLVGGVRIPVGLFMGT